jgi:ribosome-associated translation inhibitor RaiA
MDLPLEIKYQGVDRNAALDRLIESQAARLERFHPHITSCRVGVSKPHRNNTHANRFRVRIRCMVPPGRELVAVVGPKTDTDPLQPLPILVRDAFGILERKLKVLSEKQTGAEKQRVAVKRSATKKKSVAKRRVAAGL